MFFDVVTLQRRMSIINQPQSITETHLSEGLGDELVPVLNWFVPRETIVRDVVGQEVQQSLAIHVSPVLDIILLGGDHGQVLLLLASTIEKTYNVGLR